MVADDKSKRYQTELIADNMVCTATSELLIPGSFLGNQQTVVSRNSNWEITI